MPRIRYSTSLLVPLLLLGAACAEAPTAPPNEPADALRPDLSLVTPFLLPPGADWGLYFVSFNSNRTLNARVIHYPNGSVSGDGSFLIPGGPSGALRVTGLSRTYGGCVPERSACTGSHKVPESAKVTGTATLLTGQRVPFRLDLHSNLWPNPTNTYDTARLTLCYSSANCASSSFYGELHHEPQ